MVTCRAVLPNPTAAERANSYLACHLLVVQYLLKKVEDVEKARDTGASPFLIAALTGHLEVLQCLFELPGVDVNKATTDADADADANDRVTPLHIAVLHRQAVLPNPTVAERANGYLACLEPEAESQGQGQASANAVAEEEDEDSGSDEEHEVAYRKSQKRQRTK